MNFSQLLLWDLVSNFFESWIRHLIIRLRFKGCLYIRSFHNRSWSDGSWYNRLRRLKVWSFEFHGWLLWLLHLGRYDLLRLDLRWFDLRHQFHFCRCHLHLCNFIIGLIAVNVWKLRDLTIDFGWWRLINDLFWLFIICSFCRLRVESRGWLDLRNTIHWLLWRFVLSQSRWVSLVRRLRQDVRRFWDFSGLIVSWGINIWIGSVKVLVKHVLLLIINQTIIICLRLELRKARWLLVRRLKVNGSLPWC